MKGSFKNMIFLGTLICFILFGVGGANASITSDHSVIAKIDYEDYSEPINITKEKRSNSMKDYYYVFFLKMYQIAVCEFNAIPQQLEDEEETDYIRETTYGERWFIYPPSKKGKVLILDALYTDTPDETAHIQVFEGPDDIDITMEYENDGNKSTIILPDGKKIKRIINEQMFLDEDTEEYFFERVLNHVSKTKHYQKDKNPNKKIKKSKKSKK